MKKTREMLYKSCLTQVKDVGPEGIVVFNPSIYNTPDRVGDIVEPGSFTKTIRENIREIQHYKNHDSTQMPGVIQEIRDSKEGIEVISKLILTTQLGRETYEQYKAMAEAGKSMGHSIGYSVIRQESGADGYNHLKEIMLYEVSTLTKRAAHPDALTLEIKSLEDMDINELAKEEAFYAALLNCEFTDAKLENLESLKNYISALIETRREVPPVEHAPLTKQDYLNILFT